MNKRGSQLIGSRSNKGHVDILRILPHSTREARLLTLRGALVACLCVKQVEADFRDLSLVKFTGCFRIPNATVGPDINVARARSNWKKKSMNFDGLRSSENAQPSFAKQWRGFRIRRGCKFRDVPVRLRTQPWPILPSPIQQRSIHLAIV